MQFASSRRDWGGIAHHSYRSVEREMREKLSDLLIVLARFLSRKIEDLTLGVMIELIRETRKHRLPSAIVDKTKSLRTVLSKCGGLKILEMMQGTAIKK